MTGSPKTLQVTYGTFSCTLEGFDDPVEALMAVAEYFYAMAVRDPGFADRAGTPDAEALAWIAKRARAKGRAREAGSGEPGPAGDQAGAMAAPEPGPAGAGAEASSHPGLQKLMAAPPGEEAALSRILSRADEQLADPEAARRRETIASLKAAVALTEAERASGEPGPGTEERGDPFRDDLREAVRSLDRMPGEDSESEPPRRAGGLGLEAEDAPGQRGGSFAGFAEEMGAYSLPSLMEAAAAWLTFVEGTDGATRAQILQTAAQVLPEPPSHEEGLRAFGALLLQGRLVPVARGRYRVGPDSRFRPGRLAD